MTLCFATNNKHKISEITSRVGNNIVIVGLKELSVFEELPETQNTFHGNAEQKALFVFNKTGRACFADDSGLSVHALGGAPGVFSARYAGPEKNDLKNIERLLSNLNPHDNREATFTTIIALAGFGSTRFFEGTIDGTIADKPRGSNGFGYDPVFVPKGYNLTFAEMTLQQKNEISHRAIASQKLIEFLNSFDGK